MKADELEREQQGEHISRLLGFSHPLVRLIPYGPDAPIVLKALQSHVWRALDPNLNFSGRLDAALSIRPAIARLDLTAKEAAKVAIDLLQGLNKLLLSAAVLEQLAWAHLEEQGIALQGRRFSSQPLHPLPVLICIDDDGSGKAVQGDKGHRIAPALGLWTGVAMEMAAKPLDALDAMCAADLRATLRMLILFLLHADVDEFRVTRGGKMDRLEDMGLSLWGDLLACLRRYCEFGLEDEELFGVGMQRAVWHQLRSQAISKKIELVSSTACPVEDVPSSTYATHTVIEGVIPSGSSDEDRQQLTRYERLRRPLPVSDLCAVSSIDSFEAGLMAEFPWAESGVKAIADDLRARRLFGGVEIGMAATLLVGVPGCGKSRLARRIAEELGLPNLTISLAGMGDSRAILGTARGWSGGQASPLINFMLDKLCASPVVVLDELDKACSNTRSDVPPTSALLNLLEPENAKRWYDTYLQTACDMSKMMFVATANILSPIPKPLISRLRIVLVPEPRPAHFPAIARGALLDIATEWGLPRDLFEDLATTVPLDGARSAREIRAITRTFLGDWARRSLGPSRLH